MNRFLGFLCLVVNLPLVAQPFIESADYINAGDVFYYNILTSENVDIDDLLLMGGEDTNWDLTQALVDGLPVNQQFFPLDSVPSTMGFFFSIPAIAGENLSNHARDFSDLNIDLPVSVTDEFQFLRNDETGYYITGNGALINGLPFVAPYDTIDKLFSFPLEYLNEEAGSFYFLEEIPEFGTIGRWGTRNVTVDAWGEVILPIGSYSCLRVRTESQVTDTVYSSQLEVGELLERPNETLYTWISAEIGGIVMEASFIEGEFAGLRHLTGTSVLSTIQNEVADWNVYPIPADDEITVNFGNARIQEIRCLDSTGREIFRKMVSNGDRLDISGLSEGMYFLADDSAGIIRFVVAR